jgi:hypothetical protein
VNRLKQQLNATLDVTPLSGLRESSPYVQDAFVTRNSGTGNDVVFNNSNWVPSQQACVFRSLKCAGVDARRVRKENAANKSANERSGSSAWALVNPAMSTRIFTAPIPSCYTKYLNRITGYLAQQSSSSSSSSSSCSSSSICPAVGPRVDPFRSHVSTSPSSSSSSPPSSSSSSYICRAVRPRVDPFRSHVSRSPFKFLPWFLLASLGVVFHYPG